MTSAGLLRKIVSRLPRLPGNRMLKMPGYSSLSLARLQCVTLGSPKGGFMKPIVIVGAAMVALLSLSACASSSTAAKPETTVTVTVTAPPPSSSAPQAETTPGARSASSPPASSQPAGAQVIARFNGSGIQNTASFTVPDDWHLSWEYWGCSGGTGNFIVEEYNTDGSTDVGGVTVNELGPGRGPVATYAYGDSGSHYFSVNSECSWSLAVVVGGS
jgi:hypothetical protein